MRAEEMEAYIHSEVFGTMDITSIFDHSIIWQVRFETLDWNSVWRMKGSVYSPRIAISSDSCFFRRWQEWQTKAISIEVLDCTPFPTHNMQPYGFNSQVSSWYPSVEGESNLGSREGYIPIKGEYEGPGSICKGATKKMWPCNQILSGTRYTDLGRVPPSYQSSTSPWKLSLFLRIPTMRNAIE